MGGGAYVGLELLYRRRSHYSMFLAGGSCLLLIGRMEDAMGRRSLPLRLLSAAGIITAVEFLTGLIFNRRYQIWDYRGCRGNVMGQICPAFCLLWVPLGGLAMAAYGLMDRIAPAGDK